MIKKLNMSELSVYCSLCKGKQILNGQHMMSKQHFYNIKKLPMRRGREWWTMSLRELRNYLHNSKDEPNKKEELSD